MDLGLRGLKALVTGGSKGIGRATAELFASEGAAVSICARDPAGVAAAVAALEAKGVPAFGRALDVADKAALEGWVAASAEALGGIDILVANVSALAVQNEEEAWRREFEVDMLHTVRSLGAALPWLERSSAAAVTIVSSVSGREVDFTGPAYGATKAALIHYAQRMAFELAPKKVRVNAVSPGNVYFEGGIWQWIERHDPALFARALALNPSGRMATAEEIARGIVFLSAPVSSFTMGTNLVIDGALTRGVQL
ncbi:MAG: SDR family oxidoreductase [Geminicoccaceae bacterium]|nr:SDR family oxidoreductase [Geminicoccaceae bacterium]